MWLRSSKVSQHHSVGRCHRAHRAVRNAAACVGCPKPQGWVCCAPNPAGWVIGAPKPQGWVSGGPGPQGWVSGAPKPQGWVCGAPKPLGCTRQSNDEFCHQNNTEIADATFSKSRKVCFLCIFDFCDSGSIRFVVDYHMLHSRLPKRAKTVPFPTFESPI